MPDALKRNTYNDEDFQKILEEIDGLNDDIDGVKDEAATAAAGFRGTISGFARKIKAAKKTAVKLQIPAELLNTVLEQRALERKLQALVAGVSDGLAEVYLDASGQFSMFKPVEGEEKSNIISMAAKGRAKAAKEALAAEQDAEKTRRDKMTTDA